MKIKNLIVGLIVVFGVSITVSSVSAKEKEQVSVRVKSSDKEKPDLYIDGKKYDHDILRLLDKDLIESIEVIKDKAAEEQYGSKNDVILIKSKSESSSIEVTASGSKGVKIRRSGSEKSSSPVVMIDGKKSTQAALESLDPDTIESINVFKGESALAIDSTAVDGLIQISLKK